MSEQVEHCVKLVLKAFDKVHNPDNDTSEVKVKLYSCSHSCGTRQLQRMTMKISSHFSTMPATMDGMR